MVSLMVSPTTTPAPSPGNSQRRPKSFRLTDVVASMPRRMPPAWLNGGGAVTARVTGLVTPCIVRLPVTEYEVALDLLKLIETKAITGYLATSKKSGPLRCVSRSSTPVVIEFTSTVTLTLELAGVASSSMTAPEGFGNMPRTLVNTCLQTNSTEEFSGSSPHFEVWERAGTDGLSGPVETAPAVAVSRELLVTGDLAAPGFAGSSPAGTEFPAGARLQPATAKTKPKNAPALRNRFMIFILLTAASRPRIPASGMRGRTPPGARRRRRDRRATPEE